MVPRGNYGPHSAARFDKSQRAATLMGPARAKRGNQFGESISSINQSRKNLSLKRCVNPRLVRAHDSDGVRGAADLAVAYHQLDHVHAHHVRCEAGCGGGGVR